MRFPFRKREKACYIKLRRLGYSTNTIAAAFGRSSSVIHRVLKRNGLTRNDLRKLPRRIRQLAAARQRGFVFSGFLGWLQWADGEGEKPP